MSVKASHGAPLGVGIILVGEGASPDSRLCPDFFFFFDNHYVKATQRNIQSVQGLPLGILS